MQVGELRATIATFAQRWASRLGTTVPRISQRGRNKPEDSKTPTRAGETLSGGGHYQVLPCDIKPPATTTVYGQQVENPDGNGIQG